MRLQGLDHRGIDAGHLADHADVDDLRRFFLSAMTMQAHLLGLDQLPILAG